MNALIAMNTKDPQAMSAIAAELADIAGIDDLSTWTPKDFLQALRAAKGNRRAELVNRKIDIAGIDWTGELETFLDYTKSPHTRRAYTAAIAGLESWASLKNINPLELNSASADRFIHDLKAQGKAAASARRDIAAVSAFYTFLERETDGKIKNPIRGTRQRPPKENKKETVIPTAADYKTILAELPVIERAIVETLARRGLRAGALPTLEKKGNKYHGASKGKALKENGKEGITLPPESIDAIKVAGLDAKKPFAKWTANGIERRINYHTGKLYAQGKIRAPYSCHDWRHFFAVNEYKATKDIYRVSMLLNHENIGITQAYLKSLECDIY